MMSLFNPHTASAGHYYCALLSIYVNLLNMSLYISQSDEMKEEKGDGGKIRTKFMDLKMKQFFSGFSFE